MKIHVALQPLLKDVHHCSKTHGNQNIFDLSGSSPEQENTANDIEFWWTKLVYIIVHLPFPPETENEPIRVDFGN
jgi:hypothetical protein